MVWTHHMTLFGTLGTVLAAAVGAFVFVHELTFDSELLAAENRLSQNSQQSDARILRELIEAQRLFNLTLRRETLTNRRDLLYEIIERLTYSLVEAPPHDIPHIEQRIRRAQRRLDTTEKELENLALGFPLKTETKP